MQPLHHPHPSHPLDDQLASLLKRLDGGATASGLGALIRHVSARTRDGVIAVPLADAPVTDLASLHESPVVGREGDYKPLILSDTHAWLYRYWQYEDRLARCIKARMGAESEAGGKLLIISGGPGTGKTTTVTRILADLMAEGIARFAHLAGSTYRQSGNADAGIYP